MSLPYRRPHVISDSLQVVSSSNTFLPTPSLSGSDEDRATSNGLAGNGGGGVVRKGECFASVRENGSAGETLKENKA